MMSWNFETSTHGKWILAGEHAVIRGHGALVFPLYEKKLTLRYYESSSELSAIYSGETGEDMHVLFWSVLEQGMQLLQKSLNQLHGHFHLETNIPIDVGMGASAALCVATARWFAAANLLTECGVAEFAQKLENLFHGQSSGLDIAGVAATSGIYFKQGQFSPLQQAWQPHWCLSNCAQIGITSHCVNQVNTLWKDKPNIAKEIDEVMAASVEQARGVLEEARSPNSLTKLAAAVNQASDCFRRWGLVSESLEYHIQSLRNAGALAVKPTGAGGGGFTLSLWEQPPFLAESLVNIRAENTEILRHAF